MLLKTTRGWRGVLWTHSDRRSRGIPYSPVPEVGNIKDRSVASELRPGRRALRTLDRRDSTQHRKQGWRIFRGRERAREQMRNTEGIR